MREGWGVVLSGVESGGLVWGVEGVRTGEGGMVSEGVRGVVEEEGVRGVLVGFLKDWKTCCSRESRLGMATVPFNTRASSYLYPVQRTSYNSVRLNHVQGTPYNSVVILYREHRTTV